MLMVSVQGGTNAGRKRPLRQPVGDWRCGNSHPNKGSHTRCMTAGCRERRPTEGIR